jgi:hypothetical protein
MDFSLQTQFAWRETLVPSDYSSASGARTLRALEELYNATSIRQTSEGVATSVIWLPLAHPISIAFI